MTCGVHQSAPEDITLKPLQSLFVDVIDPKLSKTFRVDLVNKENISTSHLDVTEGKPSVGQPVRQSCEQYKKFHSERLNTTDPRIGLYS